MIKQIMVAEMNFCTSCSRVNKYTFFFYCKTIDGRSIFEMLFKYKKIITPLECTKNFYYELICNTIYTILTKYAQILKT